MSMPGITHVVVMIDRPRKVACAQLRAHQGALCACTLQTRASCRRVPSWGQLSRTRTSRSECELLAAHGPRRGLCAHHIKTWVSTPTFSRNSPPQSVTSIFERFPRSLYQPLAQQASKEAHLWRPPTVPQAGTRRPPAQPSSPLSWSGQPRARGVQGEAYRGAARRGMHK